LFSFVVVVVRGARCVVWGFAALLFWGFFFLRRLYEWMDGWMGEV